MKDKGCHVIETTFGSMKIFNDNFTENSRTTSANLNENSFSSSRRRRTAKVQKKDEIKIEEKKEQPNDDVVNDKEGFYGFESIAVFNNKQNNKNGNDNLNFFDEQLVGSYDLVKNEKNANQQNVDIKKNIKIDTSDLNFIDNFYFNSETTNSNQTSSMSSARHITKDEILNEDLNYIDTVNFKKQVENDDTNHNDSSSFGSLVNFQMKTKSKKPLAEIPLIKSDNIADIYQKSTRMNFANRPKAILRNEIAESNHLQLKNEVPNWFKMTISEAVDILKNHVCYYNEKNGIFALDKPYGLPCMGGPKINLSVAKLLPMLKEELKLKHNLLMCHRLDELTTGVLLFATNQETCNKIREYFDSKKMIKQYLAITKNIPESPDGEINIPLIRRSINGNFKTFLSPEYNETTEIILKKPNKENNKRREAITKYRVIDSKNKSALVEVQLITGFQHQIRSHLAYGLGCPILGDHKYSHHVQNLPQRLPHEMLNNLKLRQSKVRCIPMHLHAKQIILPEFWNSENIFISAKLPMHFMNNLKRLKLRF